MVHVWTGRRLEILPAAEVTEDLLPTCAESITEILEFENDRGCPHDQGAVSKPWNGHKRGWRHTAWTVLYEPAPKGSAELATRWIVLRSDGKLFHVERPGGYGTKITEPDQSVELRRLLAARAEQTRRT